MTTSLLPYDIWLQEALRSVIHRALTHTAEFGLSGGHHFYITFVTHADGVELAADLQAKYPDEMTIVLQHQFWDLNVADDHFAVTLKFRGRSSRIRIPFAAISAFGDPSVNFGLQLKTISIDDPLADGLGDLDAAGGEAGDGDAPKQGTGEVIALDTFRKK